MAQMTRENWVDAAFDALGKHGIQGVRVETLAKNLAVSKGSFYWHFENRQALYDAMLDTWETAGTLDIIEHVNAISDDPIVKLRELGSITFRPSEFDRVEANMRIWGATYQPAAARCQKIDTMRIRYVADLLVAYGMPKKIAQFRADLMYLALIGNTTRLNTGGPKMPKGELQALLEMLLGAHD